MDIKYTLAIDNANIGLENIKREITSTIHDMLKEYGVMNFGDDDNEVKVTINGDDRTIVKAYVCDSEDVTFMDDMGYDFFMMWDIDIEGLIYLAERISNKMEEEEND